MTVLHTEGTQSVSTNPGESLRQAREAKGWSVAEVATQLHLTPQRLNELENGQFDKLPGITFARGYIRTYAKLLGLDQNRLVVEFDQFTGSDASGSSVHSLGRIEEPVRYSQKVLRLISFLLLLALVGGGFLWWQDQGRPVASFADFGLEHVEVDGADGTTQVHSLAEPEDQAVLAGQGSNDLSEPLLLPGESSPGDAVPGLDEQSIEPPVAVTEPNTTAPGTPAETVVQPPVPAAEPVQPAREQQPTAAAATAGHGAIQVKFTADCWTQVTDADGKVLVSALKRGGESLELTGKAPMELRLGFARGAQVSYNGEAVDVSPFTSGETARLKLGL